MSPSSRSAEARYWRRAVNVPTMNLVTTARNSSPPSVITKAIGIGSAMGVPGNTASLVPVPSGLTVYVQLDDVDGIDCPFAFPIELTVQPPSPSKTMRPMLAKGSGGTSGWFGPLATNMLNDELNP